MTAQPDPEQGPSRIPFKRREPRQRGTGTRPPVERFRDPGPVSSKSAYGRSIYKASQVNVLLARYDRIRGDLLMAWPSADEMDPCVQEAGVVCCELLHEAKEQLQKRTVTLTVVAHLLTLADRAMVSLYSDEVMRFRVHTLENRLRGINAVPDEHITNLALAQESLDKGQRGQAETAVKDVLNFIGEQSERGLIEDDLQVSRLSKAIVYVAVGWLLLLAIVPFVSTVQRGAGGQLVWPLVDFSVDRLNLFLGGLGLSVVGAVGGIVSGMFTVRDSVTDLLRYRTSVKRMALKPLFGAVAALTLYFFLSANLITGVAVTSAGTYVVAAFLAGFSERYFLRFVDHGMQAVPPAPAKGDPAERAGAKLNLVPTD